MGPPYLLNVYLTHEFDQICSLNFRQGDVKADNDLMLQLLALLHGHSYSGHSIGCQAAITALQWLANPERNPNLLPCKTRLMEVKLFK